ncbi:hypothetical protein PR202_gb25169 [Eleusine coracana subsp. coracana]|uniref:Replication protein A subunit n=1 Tax=Eleusine coracana subsp. coracana TaxID=191504 RepID=A0AAV5FNJ8_ELECO|nr:hypothetical protein PR202_gb25169 [Eleusine coracana subsp. coracana]
MGGGGGVGLEVELSRGAVAAILRMAEGLRPVLQVADSPRLAARAAAQRYRILLSDSVHSHEGVLAVSMNHLISDGSLRRGAVVRVLDYICTIVQGRRVIVVIQLEILRTDCTLIGDPTIYEATPTQPFCVSYSGGLGNHESCFLPGSQEVFGNLSCFSDQGMLDSSFGPRAEHTVCNLQYGGSCGSVLPLNTVDAKVQQLSLDDHHQNQRWTIKARVTVKTDLRHYQNARGTGKVFSFDLLDAKGGEIRVTCFNLQVDRYFDLIEVDKVYLISRGIVKPAHKKYYPLNSDYEIYADDSTFIEVCSDDDCSIPKQQYAFQQISEIENMENGSLVDLLGVVTLVSPSATITRKDGTGTQKRTLHLKDMSGRSVEITLRGKFCDGEGQVLQRHYDSGSSSVLAVKGGRISDFSSRFVVTISSTQLKVNPDFPDAERLRQWYLTEGKTAACISLSQEMSSFTRNHVPKTIAQIKDESLGQSGKPDVITVRATISHVNANNFCYPACTLEFNGKQCNRKVTKSNEGAWHCDRCVLDVPKCEYRYLLMCQLQDHTGVTYATAFQEAGTKIIGYSAEELFNLREQDEAKWEEIMLQVCRQEYLFKLNITEENLYGETRAKCNIVGVEKLDALATNHHLLEEMETARALV